MKTQIKTIIYVSVIFFLVIAFVWKLITFFAFKDEKKPQNRFVLHLNENGYASSSTASLLFFNNNYPEGMQGGIELITHDERVAANGDLRVMDSQGQWGSFSSLKDKILDEQPGAMKVLKEFEDLQLRYEVEVVLLENSFRLTVNLEKPLPRSLQQRVYFNFYFLPSAYEGKYFIMDQQAGLLGMQDPETSQEKNDQLLPVAEGGHLILAPEDALKKIEIIQEKGMMKLFNDQKQGQGNWYRISSEIETGASEKALVWQVNINQVKEWTRQPQMLHSQIGYHPDQEKVIMLELPRAERYIGKVLLSRIDHNGDLVSIKLEKPSYRGKFLRYHYYAFNFSGIKEEGLYQIEYNGLKTTPFLLSRDLYHRQVWQPTLGTFIPVQMDHYEVRDRDRVWHGLSHTDDALQAPPGKVHFDSYRMDDTTWTSFKPFEHIPGLNEGGWYDAGDYDLRTISHINTVYWLGLAYNSFNQQWDQTTVDQADRKVILHRPDGIPDLVQQVRHGAVYLLNCYKNTGHAIAGIISPTIKQYVHLGDGSLMTDNLVYDPRLDSTRRDGRYSGLRDDRLAFTNKSSALDYGTAKALALSSRVLDEYYPDLAEECLLAAGKIWEYEQVHDPVVFDGGQTYSELLESEMISATAELMIVTGDEKYKEALKTMLPVIEDEFKRTIASVARVNDLMGTEFQDLYRIMAGNYIQTIEQQIGSNPFGVPWKPAVWGVGWDLQEYAAQLFYLYQAFPDLVEPELILRVVNFVLGTHPGSNISFVSGVGAHSMTIAYGINRADYSHIPGGVVSGTALIRPDFPELKEDWPFLWQQSEYVIDGAATWILCVLAADQLLN